MLDKASDEDNYDYMPHRFIVVDSFGTVVDGPFMFRIAAERVRFAMDYQECGCGCGQWIDYKLHRVEQW